MALSTLRMGVRSRLFQQPIQMLRLASAPSMSNSAQDQMKAYWEKNQSLGRPNSPWLVYEWKLPMMTSLTHRITGVAMVTGLYAGAIGVMLLPMDVTAAIEVMKSWDLSPAVWFPLKFTAAFPLMYHSLNGIRHLYWDYKGGYEINTQYKTGAATYGGAVLLSTVLAMLAYL